MDEYIYVIFFAGEYENRKTTRHWIVAKYWQYVFRKQRDKRIITIWTTRGVFDQMSDAEMNAM